MASSPICLRCTACLSYSENNIIYTTTLLNIAGLTYLLLVDNGLHKREIFSCHFCQVLVQPVLE